MSYGKWRHSMCVKCFRKRGRVEKSGVGKSLKSCANGRFVASALEGIKAVFTCGKTLAVGN